MFEDFDSECFLGLMGIIMVFIFLMSLVLGAMFFGFFGNNQLNWNPSKPIKIIISKEIKNDTNCNQT